MGVAMVRSYTVVLHFDSLVESYLAQVLLGRCLVMHRPPLLNFGPSCKLVVIEKPL